MRSRTTVCRYFDFAATGSAIKSVVATSSIDAFEIDNVSFSAAVPEAATWTMMLGLDVVGGSLRRRSAATRVSFA